MTTDVHSTTSIADRIAEKLLERIRIDDLSVGDVLPSERNLMREFSVSRLTCREALATLRGMGILKTRHGKGAYVADIRDVSMSPALLRLLQVHGEVSNANVLEARLIIEPMAAGLAAQRASAAEKEAIVRQTLQQANDLADLPVVERAQRFAESDVAFHQVIGAASGNPVLPMIFKSMHELLLRVRLEALILRPGIAGRALKDHHRIAATILAGDRRAAEKAMASHIRLRGKELLKDTQRKLRQK